MCTAMCTAAGRPDFPHCGKNGIIKAEMIPKEGASMAVTLQQIADACGVSRGTVDRALHGKEGVRPSVAQAIREKHGNWAMCPASPIR